MYILLTILIIRTHIQCYSTLITIDTNSIATIENYNQDFSTCQCNLMPNLCDPYCCCDSTCSSSQISDWTDNSNCQISTISIEKFCFNLEDGSLGSFEDLGCVYYSNRGQIGKFYGNPNSISTGTTTTNKFAYYYQNPGSKNTTPVQESVSESVGPGYASSSMVQFQLNGEPYYKFNIHNIADQTKKIYFGQPLIQATNNTCNNSSLIHKIATMKNLQVYQWQNKLNDILINVTPATNVVTSCQNYTHVRILILYSQMGWQLELQNYIIGAEIIVTNNTNNITNINNIHKYLRIDWLYVSPQDINLPPNNKFYQYFQLLSKPFQQFFGIQ